MQNNNKELLEKEENGENIEEVEETSNEIIEEEELTEEQKEINEVEEKIYQIDLKMQELLVQLEKIEDSYSYENRYELEDNEEYLKLKAEYKSLGQEKKSYLKEISKKDKSKLSEVSVWVIIYGIILTIVSFPLITLSIWTDFAVWVLDLFSEAFSNLNTEGFLHDLITFLVIFSLPLLINLVTWLVHNNFIKTKTDRKVFVGFWIIQGLMSIGVIIYMCTLVY